LICHSSFHTLFLLPLFLLLLLVLLALLFLACWGSSNSVTSSSISRVRFSPCCCTTHTLLGLKCPRTLLLLLIALLVFLLSVLLAGGQCCGCYIVSTPHLLLPVLLL
jgi:hypothetical protein